MDSDRRTLLVLARHGQSERNALMQGHPLCPTPEAVEYCRRVPDALTPLTENGCSQAEALGRTLNARFGKFDLVIHSGFTRARQTAELVIQHLQLHPPVIVDPRFRERDSGYAYAMSGPEFHGHFPWMQRHWDSNWFSARPPGGESVADVLFNRATPALKDVIDGNPGKRILVVTHGTFIRTCRLWLENLPLTGKRCLAEDLPNCDFVTYQTTPGGYPKPIVP